jgi:hypothetical protein
VDEPVIDKAFTTLTRRGLPAVRGEVIDGHVTGYHYYPGRGRVTGSARRDCRSSTRASTRKTAGVYRHFLLQKSGSSASRIMCANSTWRPVKLE